MARVMANGTLPLSTAKRQRSEREARLAPNPQHLSLVDCENENTNKRENELLGIESAHWEKGCCEEQAVNGTDRGPTCGLGTHVFLGRSHRSANRVFRIGLNTILPVPILYGVWHTNKHSEGVVSCAAVLQ